MSDEGAWYIDSSALVKLAVAEQETPALRADLRQKPVLASSELLLVEVARATRRHGDAAVHLGRAALMRLSYLVAMNHVVLERAGTLDPGHLRSLDAIHLSTALGLGADLAGVITYDERLGSAAASLGMRVASPGR
jgi:predicted nucleic acid-binding protein